MLNELILKKKKGGGKVVKTHMRKKCVLLLTCYTLTHKQSSGVVGGGGPFVGCNCEVIWFEGREVKGHRSVVKRPQPAAVRSGCSRVTCARVCVWVVAFREGLFPQGDAPHTFPC